MEAGKIRGSTLRGMNQWSTCLRLELLENWETLALPEALQLNQARSKTFSERKSVSQSPSRSAYLAVHDK